LRGLGAEVAETAAFADHHPYSEDEAMRLIETAQRLDAVPVTTAKDFVRLPEGAKALVTSVGVHLRFEAPDRLDAVVRPVLAGALARAR
jgi:tetraacyldisaccharide 4'-kinase